MTCTFTAECPMYETVSRVAELNFWLEHYCRGEADRCEQLQRSLAGVTALENRLPSGGTATCRPAART